MNRRVTQLFVLILAVSGGLAWLHFQVVPGIRWSNGNGVFYGEWRAVLKAWPLWLIGGSIAGLFGFVTFGFIGESERERAYKQRAEKAEAEATQARKDAENAAQRAQAALEDKQREAREQIKIAKSEQEAAADEIERIREQNAEIRAAHDTMKKRLAGSLKAQDRGKEELLDTRKRLFRATGGRAK